MSHSPTEDTIVEGDGPTFVMLHPNRWTPIPGTRLVVRWDGEHAVGVRRRGRWDLTPLASAGRVMAWLKLADHPELGSWPLLPSPGRAAYRTRRSI